jgi:chromosome segregation ATPase
MLADSNKEKDMFRQQLKQKETVLDDLRQAMEDNEISFKVEIEKLQTVINDIQERGRNEISQALTDLDSSKAQVNRLEVELTAAQSANQNLQVQSDLLKMQIGDLREKVGDLKREKVLAQLDLAKNNQSLGKSFMQILGTILCKCTAMPIKDNTHNNLI